MDKKTVFDILCISETKDADIIKGAYREQLIHVNPEDNPEGFKALREAYEEALRLINVQEEEDTPNTPIDQWIQKIEKLYNKRSTRMNLDCWRKIFEEEICKDFDTSNQAKEALLSFLMNHYRLSTEVWKLLEETFHFVDSKNELYEKFPTNFVDFIADTPESKGWIDYSLFEGNDEADIDGFIDQYLSLRGMNDYKEYDEIEAVIYQLENGELWHPYFEIEKMRYYMNSERLKEAIKIGEILYQKQYGDLYIKYYLAVLSLNSGNIEKAYSECRTILEVNPNHFGAKTVLCSCYLEKGEYEKAKDGYLDLLELENYNEVLIEGLKETNKNLIIEYKKQLEREPHNKEITLELGWCLFQNGLYEECISFIKDLEIDETIYYEYYNLISRTYIAMEDYEKAYPYLKIWLNEILKVQDDGTEKTQNKLRRLSFAYYLMSKCHHHFYTANKHNHETINDCLKYLDKAIEQEGMGKDVLKYLSEKANILLEIGENKLCIDVCDKIINLSQDYFPAYVYRQEAFFNLRMGQEVIDDFYNAIDIYQGYAKPYILATKVFINFEQYEDAKGIINRAKDARIASKELKFHEIRIRRLEAETNEERKEIIQEIDALYAQSQKELEDLEDISALLHEKAICYFDMGENNVALQVINEKLKLKKTDGSMELKGDILYRLKEYKEVITIYEDIVRKYPDYVYAHYILGFSYGALNKEKEALDNYLKVVEIDPEHRFVNNKIMNIYQNRYNRDFKQEDYKEAVHYAKRQVEINPNCYYYNELGLLYLDGYDLEAALEAFSEATKYDETNLYAYNNKGFVYKILGKYDEAYKYYKLAIEHQKDDDLIAHWNIAVYYKITGQYEKAIKTYEMLIEKSDNPKSAVGKLADLYQGMKEWDMAIKYYKKKFQMAKNAEDGEVDYFVDMGDIYCLIGDKKQAIECIKKAMKKYSKRSAPYTQMGNYMCLIEGKKKKALKYYKKAYYVAIRYEPNHDDYLDELLYNILFILKLLNQKKEGIKYKNEYYRYIKRLYGSIENWLNDPGCRKTRLYLIALCNYNIGNYEEAKHYIDLMKKARNCRSCSHSGCFEYYELEGVLLEIQGDYKGALEKYQKSLDIHPDNIPVLVRVKEMKEKVGER